MSNTGDDYTPWDNNRRKQERRKRGRSLSDILGDTGMSAEERSETISGGSNALNNTGWIATPQSSRMTDMYYHYADRAVCVKWVKNGRRGRDWVYRNVPPGVWEDFQDYASKGKFVNLGFTPPGGSPLYDHGPPTAWEASRYFN